MPAIPEKPAPRLADLFPAVAGRYLREVADCTPSVLRPIAQDCPNYPAGPHRPEPIQV